MADDTMRTPSGAPSQKARDAHGNPDGSFPIFDHKSAHDALQLRGHSPDPAKIIARVRAWANSNGDKAILDECDAATETDNGDTDSDDSGMRSDEMVALGVETRAASVDVDGVNFDERIITVIAAPYDVPAQVPFRGAVWNELFTRSAFNGFDPLRPGARQVPATASLVVPNPNHEKGHLMGRVSRAFPDDPRGLITEVKVAKTPIGDETLELARDRSISASVGFMVKDPKRDQHLDRYTQTRKINRAFLHHLAFVAEPAYGGTSILSVRSTQDVTPIQTPRIDDILNDPIFQLAHERVSRWENANND